MRNGLLDRKPPKKYETMKRPDAVKIVIGIDPDVDKSGVAFLECSTRKLEITTLSFPDLLDYLQWVKKQAGTNPQSVRVIIEAGWLNQSNWHLTARDTRAACAAKGNHAGRNHETGRKIAEMCDHWQIPYELVKPLALKVRGFHLWKGKDGKITQEELAAFTGIRGRTNQEGRDAALLAWTWAGFPTCRMPLP